MSNNLAESLKEEQSQPSGDDFVLMVESSNGGTW